MASRLVDVLILLLLINEIISMIPILGPTIQRVNCGTNSATIWWRKSYEHRPIEYFTIEYKTNFTPDTWNVVHKNISADVSRFRVALSPWNSYTFRVVTWYKYIGSRSSTQSIPCITPPAVPYKNPDNVEVLAISPTSLKIIWTPMSETEHAAEGFMYKVYWKLDHSAARWNIVVISNWKSSELILKDQPIFERYRVKVLALNQLGEARISPREIVGYSGQDTPLEAPGNFSLVKMISSTTVIVSWFPVNVDSVRGHFIGYELLIYNKNPLKQQRSIKVKPYKTQLIITDLTPDNTYNAKICAYSNHSAGPDSNYLHFTTLKVVSVAIDKFKAYQSGSTSFYLVWEKPEDHNTVLFGYKIYYYEKEEEMSNMPFTIEINNAAITNYNLKGLELDTEYRLAIQVITQNGYGVEYSIVKTTRSVPDLKPELPNFKAFPRTSLMSPNLTNIEININTFSGCRCGSYYFAKYRRLGHLEYNLSELEFERDSILIKNLLDGIYEITVVAVDGEFETESIPVKVSTSVKNIFYLTMSHYLE